MPETRYRKGYTYPADMPAADKIPANATIVQEPYEVSDAQLALEAIEKETLTANDQAKAAYLNWANLTATQKDKVQKALLGDYIGRNKEKYL